MNRWQEEDKLNTFVIKVSNYKKNFNKKANKTQGSKSFLSMEF